MREDWEEKNDYVIVLTLAKRENLNRISATEEAENKTDKECQRFDPHNEIVKRRLDCSVHHDVPCRE